MKQRRGMRECVSHTVPPQSLNLIVTFNGSSSPFSLSSLPDKLDPSLCPLHAPYSALASTCTEARSNRSLVVHSTTRTSRNSRPTLSPGTTNRSKQILSADNVVDQPILTWTPSCSEEPEYYAKLYQSNGLTGAHVIMLGPGNDDAAKKCLKKWPSKSASTGQCTWKSRCREIGSTTESLNYLFHLQMDSRLVVGSN